MLRQFPRPDTLPQLQSGQLLFSLQISAPAQTAFGSFSSDWGLGPSHLACALHDYMITVLCLPRQALSLADRGNPQCPVPLRSGVGLRGDGQVVSGSVCWPTEAQKGGFLCFRSLLLCVNWRFCSRPLETPRPCQSPLNPSLCSQEWLSMHSTFIILLGISLTSVSP